MRMDKGKEAQNPPKGKEGKRGAAKMTGLSKARAKPPGG
jgi:hypothetical protein